MARGRRLNPANPKPWQSGDAGSDAQQRYLRRGVDQPGGKLPLFDEDGQEIPKTTIKACLAHGWAEPWSQNPIHPDWLVCRLTDQGYRLLGFDPVKARKPLKI